MADSRRMRVTGTCAIGMAALALAVCTPGPRGQVPAPNAAADGRVLIIPPLSTPAPPRPGPGGAVEQFVELSLREVQEPAAPGPAPTAPEAGPLSVGETAALLARLPALPPAQAQPFRFPASSPPPPRAGAVVRTEFPGPGTLQPAPVPAEPEPAPLEVERILPAGETDLAPHVTVTFNQPMVALGTVAGAVAQQDLVRLTPRPAGQWVWQDVRTLRFVPEQRLPMATAFVVEVDESARSASGQQLPERVRSEFSTPAPRALGGYPALHGGEAAQRGEPGRPYPGRPSSGEPGASVVRQPVMLVLFEQAVDAAAMLPTVRLLADGAARPIRPATDAEIQGDSIAAALIVTAPRERWLALRPVQPLPGAATVQLIIGQGSPSAEGPLRTVADQEMRFRTYGPLTLDGYECWGQQECPPGSTWAIRFSNAIDPATWADSLVTFSPALPGAAIHLNGGVVHIEAEPQPERQYRVTFADGIRDVFGQPLTGSRTITIRVGAAMPALHIVGTPFLVLDPDGPPRVRVQARGVRSARVRIYRVRPEDWPAFTSTLQQWRQEGRGSLSPPGTQVVSTVVEPAAGTREFGEVVVDVAAALTDGLGHAVVVVENTELLPFATPRERPVAVAWVQATRLGITAVADGEQLLVWASSLRTASPAAGATVRLLPGGGSAVTGADGVARLDLGPAGATAVVVSSGADAALIPENEHGYSGGGGWSRLPRASELRWFVISDRGIYKPGETVQLKGWLRRVTARSADPAIADASAVSWRVAGPMQEEVASGTVTPGALGGFHMAVELPDALNLGHVAVQLEARTPRFDEPGRQAWHSVQVQEFRRPDYVVAAEAEPGPHFIGGDVVASLSASYYSGGALAGAKVQWRVLPRPAQYAPPGWPQWRFGRDGGYMPGPRDFPQDPDAGWTLDGITDAAGRHIMAIGTRLTGPPFPVALNAMAEVQDLTRQVGSASVGVLLHPAALTVGLRLERSWIRPGQPVRVDAVAVDHEGVPVAGRPVVLRLERITWDWRAGGEQTAHDEGIVCELASSTDPVHCEVAPTAPGSYRVVADSRDSQGRATRSEIGLWVSGGAAPRPGTDPGALDLRPDREEYQPGDTARIALDVPFQPAEGLLTVRRGGLLLSERFVVQATSHEILVPITEEHLGGADIRVQLLDTRRGTRHAAGGARLNVPPLPRRLQVAVTPAAATVQPGAETVLSVRVTDAAGRPAADAEVALWMVDEAVLALGGYRLDDPLRTFYAPLRTGSMERGLRQWVVDWPVSAGPGTVSGVVMDASTGRTVAGAVVRIDGVPASVTTAWDGSFTVTGVAPGEHVLRVTLPNDIEGQSSITVPPEGVHVGSVLLGRDRQMQVSGKALGTGGMAGAGTIEVAALTMAPQFAPAAAPPPPLIVAATRFRMEEIGTANAIEVRGDFAPLAVFEPGLRTDAQGRAQVRVRMPQSLTRYRVMAVAVAGARHFGTGESTVTARQDLMVRITAPRFLNFGDRFELPVLVQNASATTLEVDIAARAAGLQLDGAAGRRVRLEPGGRTEIRFDATAAHAGAAHVQVVAVAGRASDAATVTLPIYTPATLEAFATYGELDGRTPALLPVAAPRGVIPQFGGLDVSITSTALHALTDALLHLHRYPFEGPEQVASRVLAVAALRDVLAAFGAPDLPPPEQLDAVTRLDVTTLAALQNPDGGWGFWRAGDPSHPFVSVHVAHALERAREAGFDVPETTRARAREFLAIADRVADWPLDAQRSLHAYALYVRHRMGDAAARSEARRLAGAPPVRAADGLPLEAAGWLLSVLAGDAASAAEAAELRRLIMNRVEETPGGASFTERYSDAEHLLLHSRRRTDAVVLEALIMADPTNSTIPRIVASLLAARVGGRWQGTQENAWVLLALDRYFRTYEANAPDFVSRVWLGDRFAGEHAFRGRSTVRQHIAVPMAELQRADSVSLLLVREGTGRLYYRAGLRYAPLDDRVEPLARGFEVSRSYSAVDDDADVVRLEDGSWQFTAGSRVRVTVTLVAPAVRHNVALMAPLAAGVEPLNPELEGVGFAPPPPGRGADASRGRPARGMPVMSPHWFSHQNLRDDRAEVFATLLPAGVYSYSFTIRATTPGAFNVPPARAEMLYAPETFGRSASERVIIR